MPLKLTYPGVYVSERRSGNYPIAGVQTSVTAFVGRTLRGPVDQPLLIQSFADYHRRFGGLWQSSTMSHAVSQFFQNGGSDAVIVRVHQGNPEDDSAEFTLTTASGALVLRAADPGLWGKKLRIVVDHDTADPQDRSLFNLCVEELENLSGTAIRTREKFLNLSGDPHHAQYVETLLLQQSSLVRVKANAPANERPDAGNWSATGTPSDGGELTDTALIGKRLDRSGIYALDDADIFNLLCLPPLSESRDLAETSWAVAAAYCQEKRAMLIVDPPQSWTESGADAVEVAKSETERYRNIIGAAYAGNAMMMWPRLRASDQTDANTQTTFAPCGAVAGVIAQTDARVGVWKAPAGQDAAFSGIQGFSYDVTNEQNAALNSVGLNSLRSIPRFGHVIWGARTLAGADANSSEWMYVPVRRMALHIEESLVRGLSWAVFEPNGETLWAEIRQSVDGFMQDQFRQGAFRGSSTHEAYFVKCDRTTTTQSDINRGVVNVVVGFAPLKPADFVVLEIQIMARAASRRITTPKARSRLTRSRGGLLRKP
jgi:phage tail sheath protein FI